MTSELLESQEGVPYEPFRETTVGRLHDQKQPASQQRPCIRYSLLAVLVVLVCVSSFCVFIEVVYDGRLTSLFWTPPEGTFSRVSRAACSSRDAVVSAKAQLDDEETPLDSTCNDDRNDSTWDWSRCLVLISLDGFHPGYLVNPNAVNLRKFGSQGVVSQGMLPQIPSLTFPNHFSLVTGMRAGDHGIVNNEFLDTSRNSTFSYKNKSSLESGWWLAEPIWNRVRRFNKASAVMFWPGSESEINGLRPNYWNTFNQTIPIQSRVDKVLAWMDLPVAQRPHLYLMYVEEVDSLGHTYGTHAPELDAGIKRVDASIGALMAGLEARGISEQIHVVIMSDHGMADITENVYLQREGILSYHDDLLRIDEGAMAFLRPKTPELIPSIVARLKAAARGRYTVYLRDQLPPEWHYAHVDRIAEIIIVCAPGRLIASEKWTVLGAHGYPTNEDVKALFMVRGPRVRCPASISTQRNGIPSSSQPDPGNSCPKTGAFERNASALDSTNLQSWTNAQGGRRLLNCHLPEFDNLDVVPLFYALLDIPPPVMNATNFLRDTLYVRPV